ncbi:hypothetical protein AB0J80_12065 [Actinoplanes sp. NPDC049548]|uniref:effector-associated constant component EACC1 n=1 Tax=Actinoplanes sp. NPDC049548 TaxID=3155152 RepID=UPI003431BF16
MPESVIPVVLTPEDAALESGDWQWGEESRRLLRLLQANDLDARLRPLPPEPGQKGAATEIILALGGSGTVGAATTILLHWLNGRSTRRIVLTVGESAGKRTLELVGEGMSEGSLRAAIVAALGPADGTDDSTGDERTADGRTPPELPPAGE